MKTALFVGCLCLAVSVGFVLSGCGAGDEAQAQTTCPIMVGNKISKKLYVDAKGKRIYVCCKGCITAVKKNPDAALKKLAESGQKAEEAPKSKDKKHDEHKDHNHH